MEYIHNITLHLTPSGEIPVIRVKQGDTSARFVRIKVIQDDEQYIPGAEQVILFREEKPDKTGVLQDSEHLDDRLHRYLVVLNGDGTISVELTDQTTACVGLCRCDLCFTSSGNAISTSPFILDVETAPDITRQIVSSDDFRTLLNAMKDIGLSSVTALEDMTDVRLVDVQSGQIIVYDGIEGKWVNRDPSEFGYLTEDSGRTLIESYGYKTEAQINVLIQNYINGLDANQVEY